jgi:hypothetical protein
MPSSGDLGGGIVKTVILLVTWFSYGQPPASSQTQFTSMDACQIARDTILRDAARLKIDWDKEVEQKTGRSPTMPNPRLPTVSAVCVVQ